MRTISLDQDISNTQKVYKAEYVVKLTREELNDLIGMLIGCYREPVPGDPFELEYMIIAEMLRMMQKKYVNVEKKAKLKLACSQARTLFLWLNEVDFEHPLHNNLARTLVDKLHKQMI